MACTFCRSENQAISCEPITDAVSSAPERKLKCDGRKTSCANCERRGIPCSYVPVYVPIHPSSLFVLTNAFSGRKIIDDSTDVRVYVPAWGIIWTMQPGRFDYTIVIELLVSVLLINFPVVTWYRCLECSWLCFAGS